MIGIKLIAYGFMTIKPPEWVVSYDPDVGWETGYPTGDIESNIDPSKAKQFADKVEAFEFVRQISTKVPTRPDGRPNRPLMAFTTEITEIPS